MVSILKRTIIICALTACLNAQKIDLGRDTKGSLPSSQVTPPGSNGQLLYNNGGAIGAEDPIVSPNQDAAQTAAWTSATSQNTVLKVTTTNRSTVTVTFNPSGTITGGVATFEVSQDNATFNQKVGVRDDLSGMDGTYTLSGSAREWTFAVGANTNFQVRLSTTITGSGTANFTVTTQSLGSPNIIAAFIANALTVSISGTPTVTVSGVSTSANQTNGSQTTQIVQGGNTATVTASGAVKTDGSAVTQPISAASLPLPSGAATDATVANPQATAGTTTAPNKIVIVGGKTSDATPQYQPVPLTNGGAAVKTDGSATTQPVSGTVTANQGTSPWTAAGNAASGSSDSGNPVKTGGIFNTTPPTVTSGQRVDQQMTNRGEALIAKGPSGLTIDNTTFSATQSGNWINRTVGNAGGILDASGQNASAPANWLQIGCQFNTSPTTIASGNGSPCQLDSAGNLLTRIAASITLPISAASLPLPANAAQETGGNLATLAGAVTASVMQENVKQWNGHAAAESGVNGAPAVGGVAAAGANVSTDNNPIMVAGSDYGGTPVKRIFKVDSNGNIYTQTVITSALPTGVNVIGGVTQSGTWNDRIQDGSGNGLTSNSSTYTSKFALDINLLGTLGTAFSTAGKIDVKGADGDVFVRQATAANLNATAVQGNAGSNAQAWWTRIGDATNGPAAVKAGSTASAAGDPSLVTALSPNSPLPAGSNLVGKAGFDNTTPGTTNGTTQYQPSRTTGTLTTASSTVSLSTTGSGVVGVTVNGTYSGVAINFEFSDDGGTTWYTTTCTRTDLNLQETFENLPTNQTRAWDCATYASTNFRVRASSYISGTANIGLTYSAASIEPAPTVSTSGLVNSFLNDAYSNAQGTGQNPVKVTIVPALNSQPQTIKLLGTLGQQTGTPQNPLPVTFSGPLPSLDPCAGAKISIPVSQSASTQIYNGMPGTWHVCGIFIVSTTAQSISLVSGTGSTCGTATIAILGSTTAANGMPPAANGGWTYGNGQGTVGQDTVIGNNLCLLQSGSGLIAGNLMAAIGKP